MYEGGRRARGVLRCAELNAKLSTCEPVSCGLVSVRIAGAEGSRIDVMIKRRRGMGV